MKQFFLILLFTLLLLGQESVILIEFNNNTETIFGNWPINRKWHALMIDKLFANNAKQIIYDFDFKYKQLKHEESDQLLYDKLFANENIYIQSADFDKDSISILGERTFKKNKIFNPFINYGLIGHQLLDYQAGTNDLFERWSDQNHFLIDLKPITIKKIDAIAFLKSDSLNNLITNNTIFVGSNIEGISSYFSLPSIGNISTTELRAYIYHKLINNQFIYYTSNIYMITLFFIVIIAFWYRKYLRIIHAGFIGLFSLVLLVSNIFYISIVFKLGIMILNLIIWFLTFKNSKQRRNKDIEQKNHSIPDKKEDQNYEILSDQDYSYVEKYKTQNIIVSKNSPLIPILKKVEMISNKDISVLVYGESGTGKELIAKLIHHLSNQSESSFFAINCGALSETLLESELFGHEAAAFTGATKRKVGRFEYANGGTIFLDEIAETSLNFQVKLLRVLQEKYIERVGSNEKIKINVRVIAATNKNVDELISAGKFREDLYYRLNGIELNIPSLRERGDDIAVLTSFFLENENITLSEDIVSYLKLQHWNGNIRELKTAVERAKINSENAKRSYLIPNDFELKGKIVAKKLDKDDLAEKILNLYKAYDYKHRASTEIAGELNIHRVTVSEYLKGWYIHFYNQANMDIEEAVVLLTNSNNKNEDYHRLSKKMKQTVDSVKTKLNLFKAENLPFEHGVKLYFKSFPSIFHSELEKLSK
jgi:transcriptional regulator with GAF, ATPase, and Fis domain